MLRVDEAWRVALPPEARRLLDPPELVRALSREAWLLLRSSSVSGPLAELDGRGRVKLPHWLRHACVPSGTVVVAAALAGAPVVAVAATVVLDSLVDAVTGVAGDCGEVVV